MEQLLLWSRCWSGAIADLEARLLWSRCCRLLTGGVAGRVVSCSPLSPPRRLVASNCQPVGGEHACQGRRAGNGGPGRRGEAAVVTLNGAAPRDGVGWNGTDEIEMERDGGGCNGTVQNGTGRDGGTNGWLIEGRGRGNGTQ